MKTEEILETYRKGSADVRMSLFFSYRDLREEFSRIEQDAPTDLFANEGTIGPAGPPRTLLSLLQRWFRQAPCASQDRLGT